MVPTDRATWALTWLLMALTAVASGSTVTGGVAVLARWGPSVGGGALIFATGASPWPEIVGTVTATMRQATAPPALRVPPVRRLRRGWAASHPESRAGASTSRKVAAATNAAEGGGEEVLAEREDVAEDERREDQERPVPQVPGVGDPPDRPHRRLAEHQRRSPMLARPHLAGSQHGAGAEDGQQGGRSRERGLRTDQEEGADRDGQSRPPDGGSDAVGGPGQPGGGRGRQGQEAADAELPGPGRQGEERPGLVGVGQPEGCGERGDGDRGQAGDGRGGGQRSARGAAPAVVLVAGAVAPGERGHEEEEGPEEVELFLDPERPVVLEGRGRRRGVQVVGLGEGEPVIAHVQGAGDPVLLDRLDVERGQPVPGGDRRDHDDEDRRREQAAGPAAVELGEGDAAGLLELAPQQPGDQVARHHEEHVDADEAAPDRADVGVEQDHAEDGDGAEAFDVRAEVAARFPGGRAGARWGLHLHRVPTVAGWVLPTVAAGLLAALEPPGADIFVTLKTVFSQGVLRTCRPDDNFATLNAAGESRCYVCARSEMLTPFDDYPVHQTALPLAHAGGGHADFYDRFWFNGYTEDFYFAVACGLYPNRGVIDAAFSVVSGGIQRSVFASGPIPADRTSTAVGPIAIDVVEPLRVNRVRVDAPDHGLVADITATARTAAYEEPRQTRYSGARLFMDVTRATQMVTWSGAVQAGGTDLDLGRPVYRHQGPVLGRSARRGACTGRARRPRCPKCSSSGPRSTSTTPASTTWCSRTSSATRGRPRPLSSRSSATATRDTGPTPRPASSTSGEAGTTFSGRRAFAVPTAPASSSPTGRPSSSSPCSPSA